MTKILPCAVVFLSLSAALAQAHAVECLDPAWTAAITQATGRAPAAGECNPRLYGPASTHEERVAAVRRTHKALQEQGAHRVPTQKLPLRLRTTEGSRHE